MKKTIDVIADRAYDESKTVLPVEYARGVYMHNAPSLRALKLMHLMIAKAGAKMAEPVRHEMRLSDIRNIDGMAHHDKESLKPLFEELRAAVLTYDEPGAMRYTVGGLLDSAVVNYNLETNTDTLINWYFGRLFVDMAEKSNHWAILDRQTVFNLGSKYSVLLFQYIASLVNLNYIQSKTFTISELRALLGVPNGKMTRFADFRRFAIEAAIEEINQLSRFKLKTNYKKNGRTITEINISWSVKNDQVSVKRELDQHKVGRKARRTGTVETIITDQNIRKSKNLGNMDSFPKEGSISYSKWGVIAREEQPAPVRDIDLVANDFRYWCSAKAIPLDNKNIEKTFRTFCKNKLSVK